MAEILNIEQVTDDLSGYGMADKLPCELDPMPVEPVNTKEMIMSQITNLALRTEAQNITDWLNALANEFPARSLVRSTGWLQINAEYSFGWYSVRFDNRDGWHAEDKNGDKFHPTPATQQSNATKLPTKSHYDRMDTAEIFGYDGDHWD